MSWGEFPADVIKQLRAREWDNAANLRRRLLGERPFPIALNLKPPSGANALQDLRRFQDWNEAWRSWPKRAQLRYERRSYREIGSHCVPLALTISSMQELIECLGPSCIERARRWEEVMSPLLGVDGALYPVLVRNLATLERLSNEEARRLARLLPSLQAGMGTGLYLRALPLQGVDTKFVESHEGLLADLLDTLHDGTVAAGGGLRRWLGCRDNPTGWLCVRPLCEDSEKRLGGLSILSLPTQQLMASALPASRILIVENLQSGLGLPPLEDTIAVFGGGRNLAWTRAAWLRGKQVGYWGDLDTWGLKLLSDARGNVPGVSALMMDLETLERFFERAVVEADPCREALTNLDAAEISLYERMLIADGRAHRLEQERLDADYVRDCLRGWTSR